jgi:hypothetical protein
VRNPGSTRIVEESPVGNFPAVWEVLLTVSGLAVIVAVATLAFVASPIDDSDARTTGGTFVSSRSPRVAPNEHRTIFFEVESRKRLFVFYLVATPGQEEFADRGRT